MSTSVARRIAIIGAGPAGLAAAAHALEPGLEPMGRPELCGGVLVASEFCGTGKGARK